jgi:preprotein translocase subunit SecE
MNEDNKKFVTVSLVLGSIIVAFTCNLLLELLAANFSVIARLESNAELANGIPVAVGALLFIFLQFNKTTADYMDGVIGELRKVVWPSRRDTGLMTVVVTITLIFSGIVVGIYDSVWAYLIKFFIK